MPDEIYAGSDILDGPLKTSLSKPGNPGANLPLKLGPFHKDQAVNVNLQNLRIFADLSCIEINKNQKFD